MPIRGNTKEGIPEHWYMALAVDHQWLRLWSKSSSRRLGLNARFAAEQAIKQQSKLSNCRPLSCCFDGIIIRAIANAHETFDREGEQGSQNIGSYAESIRCQTKPSEVALLQEPHIALLYLVDQNSLGVLGWECYTIKGIRKGTKKSASKHFAVRNPDPVRTAMVSCDFERMMCRCASRA